MDDSQTPPAIDQLMGLSDSMDGMLEKALSDEKFKRLAREYRDLLEEAKKKDTEPDQERLEEIGKQMDQRMGELGS